MKGMEILFMLIFNNFHCFILKAIIFLFIFFYTNLFDLIVVYTRGGQSSAVLLFFFNGSSQWHRFFWGNEDCRKKMHNIRGCVTFDLINNFCSSKNWLGVYIMRTMVFPLWNGEDCSTDGSVNLAPCSTVLSVPFPEFWRSAHVSSWYTATLSLNFLPLP